MSWLFGIKVKPGEDIETFPESIAGRLQYLTKSSYITISLHRKKIIF